MPKKIRLNEVEFHLQGSLVTGTSLKKIANEDLDIIVSFPNDEAYPKNTTYLNQILYIIKSKNRFLHNSEITEELFKYNNSKPKEWLKRRVSAVLSHGIKEVDTLINYRFSNSKQDTVWGNKNWIDDKGIIKSEYNFTPKERTVQSKINF